MSSQVENDLLKTSTTEQNKNKVTTRPVHLNERLFMVNPFSVRTDKHIEAVGLSRQRRYLVAV